MEEISKELPKLRIFDKDLLRLFSNITKNNGYIYGGFVSNVLIPACYGQKIRYHPYIHENLPDQTGIAEFLEGFINTEILDAEIDIDIYFTNCEDMCHFLLDTFADRPHIRTDMPCSQMICWNFYLKSKEYRDRFVDNTRSTERYNDDPKYPFVSREFIEMLNFAKENNGVLCEYYQMFYGIYLDTVCIKPVINDFNCNLIKAQVNDSKVTFSLLESDHFAKCDLDGLLNSVANSQISVSEYYLSLSGYDLDTIKKLSHGETKETQRIHNMFERGYDLTCYGK